MGAVVSSAGQQRKGVRYDPKQDLMLQLTVVDEEEWSPIARLNPFIFHALELRISVQASWSTHCTFDDNGTPSSYPFWNGYCAPSAEREAFPLHKATSFELAIQRLDVFHEFLNPSVLIGIVTQDVVDDLYPCWADDDEIGSEVPKETVVNLLNQLAAAEAQEYSNQLQRSRDRHSVYEEELMKHVWHPDKETSFESLGVL
jgi:hypothetical protein